MGNAGAQPGAPTETAPTQTPGEDRSQALSRRRKFLLGLALLIALTGALQAVMRLKQGPIVPATVDELTL